MACSLSKPDILDGFAPLDPLMFVDLPDQDTVRVTAALEQSFVDAAIANGLRGLTKTYCHIGIQDMVVDFSQPVEDDAIRAILTRAVYVWDVTGDPVGWRLDALGERPICARGDDPLAPVCP
ncbi:MAG: hypothetical protein AAFP28_10200 [Pseudomonadota bacterium]